MEIATRIHSLKLFLSESTNKALGRDLQLQLVALTPLNIKSVDYNPKEDAHHYYRVDDEEKPCEPVHEPELFVDVPGSCCSFYNYYTENQNNYYSRDTSQTSPQFHHLGS